MNMDNLGGLVVETQSTGLVKDSLDSLGMRFKDFYGVPSADFRPYKDGALFVVGNT